MKTTKSLILPAVLIVFLFTGCLGIGGSTEQRMIKHTIFIGVDVSTSFFRSPYFDDALKFVSYYIYGHMHELGGLREPKALYVTTIGGFTENEAKSFRPIEDFESKTVEQIYQDLKGWLTEKEEITDFNVFFEKVKELIQKRNLILSPIDIVIVSDGEPALYSKEKKRVVDVPIKTINLTPLEYLARNITVRLLYPSPVIADKWEKDIDRNRTRIWTVDSGVMNGWKEKLKENAAPEDQVEMWKWIEANVDFRVRAIHFEKKKK
jgi:hypothetical protein